MSDEESSSEHEDGEEKGFACDFGGCHVCGPQVKGWYDLSYFPDPEDERLYLDEASHLKRRLQNYRDIKNSTVSGYIKRWNPDKDFEVPSLEFACIELIFKSTFFFTQFEKCNPFDSISNPLRNTLLEHFSKMRYKCALTSSDKQHKMMSLLLNQETKSFKFEKWLNWSLKSMDGWTDKPERLQRMIKEISIWSPQIEEIKVIHYGKLCQVDLTAALPMLSLRSLIVANCWTWSDSHLQLLPLKCPNIQHLEIIFGEVSHNGFGHLSGLKKLKNLFFTGGDKQILYNLAVQQMPWLKKVLHDKDEAEHNFASIVPTFKGGPFALESLHSSTKLPPETCLPKLNKLIFEGPFSLQTRTKSLELLSSYQNLNCLHLSKTRARDLLKVVTKVGAKLNELKLFKTMRPFDLAPILKKCPNLNIFVNKMVESSSSFPYSSCEDLDLSEMRCFESEFGKGTAPPGLLQNLLGVAEIESLIFDKLVLRQEELAMFEAVDRSRLQHLKSLKFWNLQNWMEEDLETLGQTFKYIACSAPRLKEIDANFSYSSVLPAKWFMNNWCSKSFCKFTNIVNFTQPLLK